MKLRDIAKAADVSLTTVSLVLNDKAGVSPEKRERIERLLLENGYQIRAPRGEGASARNICFLKYSKHSYLVNGNPGFVTQIMDAVARECRRHDYNLLITTPEDLGGAEPAGLLENPSTLGAILLGTELATEDIDVFRGLEKPLVVVDNGLPGLPFSAVTMDNRAAIFAAVEHLYRLGHRQIGFLYNSYASGNDRERRAAYQEALLALGCRFDPELVYSIFPTMDGARESVSSLLDRRVRFPRALVANNDSIAIGAMRAFRDRGIRIPEDISIFGFDGLPFSAVSEPPLSTVNVPCVDVGRCAVQLLHDSIRGRCSTHCKILVGTQLLIRGSTAPPGTRRNCPWLLPEEG